MSKNTYLSKYADAGNFTPLGAMSHILVSGPQRSGTRIASQMIAMDTGHTYVDEIDISGDDPALLKQVLTIYPTAAIHCPAMSHMLHLFARPDTLVVFMMRDIDAIIASQKRIKWTGKSREMKKYGKKKGVISEIKYEAWEQQKKQIPHWIELRYTDLSQHQMWKEKDERQNFKWYQTS